MFHLSRISRWAAMPCLVLNMLGMGLSVAAGKAGLSELGNTLCNAPLGSMTTHANTLTLPAQAIWQNRSQILMPGASVETNQIWRLLSSAQGKLQVQVGQVARGADQAFRL